MTGRSQERENMEGVADDELGRELRDDCHQLTEYNWVIKRSAVIQRSGAIVWCPSRYAMPTNVWNNHKEESSHLMSREIIAQFFFQRWYAWQVKGMSASITTVGWQVKGSSRWISFEFHSAGRSSGKHLPVQTMQQMTKWSNKRIFHFPFLRVLCRHPTHYTNTRLLCYN